MRIFPVFLFVLLTPAMGIAQRINFDSVVVPLDTIAIDFREYLVQLAWMNNPENAVAQRESKIVQLQSANTRKEWMRDIGLSFNVNEANIESFGQPLTETNSFFPRWNFAIGISPYNIFTQPTKNKISRQREMVAKMAIDERMLATRRETLLAYERFKAANESLSFRAIFEKDAYNNYLLVKQLYEKDELNFQDYSAASSAYFQAQEMRQKSDIEVRLAQYDLEALIGVRWEHVQHPAKNPQ